MTDRFALFVFHQYEALGGIDDLELIGSMEECEKRAIEMGRQENCQIVALPYLRVVRRGRWGVVNRSDVTGLTADRHINDWHFEWSTEEK